MTTTGNALNTNAHNDDRIAALEAALEAALAVTDELRDAASIVADPELIEHWAECPLPPDAFCDKCRTWYRARAVLGENAALRTGPTSNQILAYVPDAVLDAAREAAKLVVPPKYTVGIRAWHGEDVRYAITLSVRNTTIADITRRNGAWNLIGWPNEFTSPQVAADALLAHIAEREAVGK